MLAHDFTFSVFNLILLGLFSQFLSQDACQMVTTQYKQIGMIIQLMSNFSHKKLFTHSIKNNKYYLYQLYKNSCALRIRLVYFLSIKMCKNLIVGHAPYFISCFIPRVHNFLCIVSIPNITLWSLFARIIILRLYSHEL